MVHGFPPPNPSTPAERLVIVWAVILLSLACGAACLYFGLTTGRRDLLYWGLGLLALAGTVWGAHRLIDRLLDS